MSKEQPEALQLPTLPFAVFDEFGQPCEDRVRDHFAASFEALRAEPDYKALYEKAAQQYNELAELIERKQASVMQQEPVMIYHGDCIIDCGEHGHHHVELLKMIPAGSHLYTHPAPQPAQANYLEMIYEYLVSTAPAGYADEAFREVPEEVFAADSRNRISERRASLSQHTGQLPAALGQEEVGTRQAGFDVTSAHPAPQQKPLTDEQIEAIFAAIPVDKYDGVLSVARAIEAAHNIGEKE